MLAGKCGGAAGDEADDEILLAGLSGEGGDAFGGGDATRIGDGMAGLDELYALEGDGVAVLDDDAAIGDAGAEQGFDGAGHGAAGFAGADNVDAGGGVELVLLFAGDESGAGAADMSEKRFFGVGGGEGGLEDAHGVAAQVHERASRIDWTASRGSSDCMGMCREAWE
jgi:hypothetical protein